jgi:hypothetical protein
LTPNLWTGGHYELLICLGQPSDAGISEALKSIWGSPLLDGPYRERDRKSADRPKTPPVEDHLFGLASAGGSWLPFGTFVVREEDENGDRAADFLHLYMPLSGLATVYPVGSYPFGSSESGDKWRPDVDSWFVRLIRELRPPLRFQIAVAGFEVSVTAAAIPDLLESALKSDERFDGIVLPSGENLRWLAPTTYRL